MSVPIYTFFQPIPEMRNKKAIFTIIQGNLNSIISHVPSVQESKAGAKTFLWRTQHRTNAIVILHPCFNFLVVDAYIFITGPKGDYPSKKITK